MSLRTTGQEVKLGPEQPESKYWKSISPGLFLSGPREPLFPLLLARLFPAPPHTHISFPKLDLSAFPEYGQNLYVYKSLF